MNVPARFRRDLRFVCVRNGGSWVRIIDGRRVPIVVPQGLNRLRKNSLSDGGHSILPGFDLIP